MNAHSNIIAGAASALSGDAIEFAGIEDGDATSGRRARRDDRRKKAVKGARAASKPYPALAAAVEAWAVTRAEEDDFYTPHDDAQQAEFALKHRAFTGGANTPSKSELRKAQLLTERTEARWTRAVDRTIRALSAILSVEPTDFAMAEAKQVAFVKAGGPEIVENAEALMNQALRRDLKALANLTPPTSPPPCPVAALIPAFELALAEECEAEDARDDEAAKAAWAKREDLQARISGLRARSTEGARLQLILALDRACDARMTDEANRDGYMDKCRDLIVSALSALPGRTSNLVWDYYIGVDRPADGDETTDLEWTTALEAYVSAKRRATTYDKACDEGAVAISGDTEASLWDAVSEALFALELTPAPDIHALAYLMRESIEYGGLFDFPFQNADSADAISDLLSGDAHEALIASTYLQILHLSGYKGELLTAAPYAPFGRGLADDGTPEALENAWRAHHAERRRGQAIEAGALIGREAIVGGWLALKERNAALAGVA